MSTIEAYSPSPKEIDDLWPRIEPLVAKGLERSGHGEYMLGDVRAALLGGYLKLWIAKGTGTPAIGLTQIAAYPRFSTVMILFCVGDGLDDWQKTGLDAIENWARDQGFRAVEVIGREGWSRRLSAHGYRKDSVTLRKEL